MCLWAVSVLVVFFTQKTAYDVRISDWVSDVWSSDLVPHSVCPTFAAAAVKFALSAPPRSLLLRTRSRKGARVRRHDVGGRIRHPRRKFCPRVALVGEVSLTGVFCVAGCEKGMKARCSTV